MKSKINPTLCSSCGVPIYEKYCSNCGHPKEIKRIDRKYILNEVGSILYFDKGILYTIKQLLIQPGLTVKTFITEDRNRIVKPIIFIIICSLIYSILEQVLNFEDGYIYIDNSSDSTTAFMFKWIANNYGYGNLIMGGFIAVWIKIFYRKQGYNFFEILILLCFVLGISMLILSVFGILEALSELKVLQYGAMVFVIYITWAIGQFFDKKKFLSYLKAFATYFLGMITFTFTLLIIGSLIDML